MNAVKRPFAWLLAGSAGGLLLVAPPIVEAQPFVRGAVERQFPIGSLQNTGELPPGRLRSQLEALPTTTQDRAVRWLRSFHFTEADVPSLHADRAGGILYVCSGATIEAGVQPGPPVVSAAALPTNPFPASLLFHSKPGAPNLLYLNFSGEAVSNTQWNTELARTMIPAVAFSTDVDFTTFSDAEQLAIKRIWQRVAEDYAPFNIDVTTERPASLSTRTAMALSHRSVQRPQQLDRAHYQSDRRRGHPVVSGLGGRTKPHPLLSRPAGTLNVRDPHVSRVAS